MAREPRKPRGAGRRDGRIVRTATEARQGESGLGRGGRWVWIAPFVAAPAIARPLLAT